MVSEDGEEVGNLPIVALTDGARNLKKEAKEVIGSGRMEKQNDVIVAHRQKRKGMSWSKSGVFPQQLVF